MISDAAPHIDVVVTAEHVPDRSNPDEDQFFFAYTVTITNTSDIAVQLLTRHWVVTNGDGDKKEVKGLGVVGEQPLIHPQAQYQYTSCALIKTPVGTMQGAYTFVTESGMEFKQNIKPFRLAVTLLLN